MKISKLMQKLNRKLSLIKDTKFESYEQYRDIIKDVITPILMESELGELLVIEDKEIKLKIKEDINVIGAGETMAKIVPDITLDKRYKSQYKGKINSVIIVIDSKLYDKELNELQPYFDIKKLENNIEWYDIEMAKLRDKIHDIESMREKDIERLKKIKHVNKL